MVLRSKFLSLYKQNLSQKSIDLLMKVFMYLYINKCKDILYINGIHKDMCIFFLEWLNSIYIKTVLR